MCMFFWSCRPFTENKLLPKQEFFFLLIKETPSNIVDNIWSNDWNNAYSSGWTPITSSTQQITSTCLTVVLMVTVKPVQHTHTATIKCFWEWDQTNMCITSNISQEHISQPFRQTERQNDVTYYILFPTSSPSHFSGHEETPSPWTYRFRRQHVTKTLLPKDVQCYIQAKRSVLHVLDVM